MRLTGTATRAVESRLLARTPSMLRRVAKAVSAATMLLLAATDIVQVLIAHKLGESLLVNSAGELGPLPFSVVLFAFPVVGFLITSRQPSNGIGWLLLGIGLCWAIRSFFFDGYLRWALIVDPGSLPGAAIVGSLSFPLWVPGIGLMGTFLILLFPDGGLPSPRWAPVAWVSAVTVVGLYLLGVVRPGPVEQAPIPNMRNPFGIDALTPLLPVIDALLLPLPVCFLACAASLVLRFRRSQGTERLQLKWLAAAGAFLAFGYLILMVGAAYAAATDAGPTPLWFDVFVEIYFVLAFSMLPVAIGVAILKHRLYDIDVVINKALVFGALAAFITAVYVAIVVGVGALAGQGDEPNLALSIAATAVVAVAFQPVRDRVQRFANRLVYGARATPYEVLSNFADRAGGSYEAAELLPMMARTVAQGVGASRVDVWLAIGAGLVREATWPQSPNPEGLPLTVTVEAMSDLEGDRVVAVQHQRELLGAVTVTKPPGEAVTPTEDKLLEDVAAQAGLVLRNVRLIEELRNSRQRLVSSQDEERRRLERNLHDGAQQSLVSVALMIRTVRARLGTDGDTVSAALDSASGQLRQAIEELRELARGIHPAILTERGLRAAIESLAERSPVPVIVDYRLEQRPSKSIEATAYFVVAEALTNVAKYASATQATVSLKQSDNALTLTITDDGAGGADDTKGSGLRGLADRIAVVDGTLDISSPPAKGTSLTCRIPNKPQTPQANAVPDDVPTPVGASQ